MMKRLSVLLLTLAMAVCCTLPAFAAGTIEVTEDVSVSGDYDWTRFKGQNITLNVYNWGEYISNGSDDSVDVVSAFEQLTGIKVNYTTFDSNESMYAKLKSGAADYDVVIPSDYMVAKMINEGMLKPLNYDNIPNFQKIDEEYRNPDYDPENAYTVPYMLCTTGIIYNTTMVDKAPTSWADLWDEQYAGNILMFNNSRDAYAIAAFKSGHDINPQSTEEVDEVVEERLHGELSEEKYAKRIESVRRFERQLTDNGYLVMKFFLHISKKEQTRRMERLTDEKDTVWRVGKKDLWQNSHYEKCMDTFSSYLKSTNMPSAPWYIVDAKSKKWTELQVLETLTQGIDIALDNRDMAVPLLQNVFPLERMPLLSEIPLDKTLDEETYRKELKHLKQRLGELHNRLYRKKVPVIIAYEGWDAAGKGGNIKRITSALDPRGYEVHPIASPEPHEKARHYLWRFWTRLPKTGHIAIFDRSWYGRVMVERLEGFCTENDWMRAYNEINEFEKELHDWGAVIIKFWVQIDKDTQLERFNERQNTPEKQWKITEEDWRNREKWDQYETAVNEMITKTSTTYAPWHILESVDKKYARIKALRIVIEELEKALG